MHLYLTIYTNKNVEDEMKQDWGTEMIMLTRKIGESIVIGKDIFITILGINGNQIRLGIDAPESMPVHRKKIYLRIKTDEQNCVFYTKSKQLHDDTAYSAIN